MTLRHVVMTRFLCQEMTLRKEQLLQTQRLLNGLSLLTGNLIPTLNNQSNPHFELWILVHPELSEEWRKVVEFAVRQSGPRFQFRLVPWGQQSNVVRDEVWPSCDLAAVTRIDIDDFIHRGAAQRVEDLAPDCIGFDHLTCGYCHTYMYLNGLKSIGVANWVPRDGYHSMFSTTVRCTKLPFRGDSLPLSFDHSHQFSAEDQRGLKVRRIHFSDDVHQRPLAIWYRHPDASSFAAASTQNRTFAGEAAQAQKWKFTPEVLADLRERFGFCPD